MVFISATSQPEATPESEPKPASMASTVSANSLLHQPHNHDIPLPQLKWTMNTNATKNNETSKKSNEIDSNPSQQLSHSTKLAQHESGAKLPEPKSSNGEKKADPIPAPGVIGGLETQKPKSAAQEKKSKLCIRLRTKEKAAAVVEPEPENEKESSIADLAAAAEEEEAVQKTWNLRPRRPVPKANGRTGAMKTGAPLAQQNKTQGAVAGSSKAGAKGAQKKDNKLKISVSLTKEEIEDDIFIMTGARPSRRPKKRNKNVQKQLDHLYPGLWLNSVSTDSYEVPQPPLKRI